MPWADNPMTPIFNEQPRLLFSDIERIVKGIRNQDFTGWIAHYLTPEDKEQDKWVEMTYKPYQEAYFEIVYRSDKKILIRLKNETEIEAIGMGVEERPYEEHHPGKPPIRIEHAYMKVVFKVKPHVYIELRAFFREQPRGNEANGTQSTATEDQ